MISYSSTATIERPPRAVYDALLDMDRYPQWTEMVDVAVDDPGEPHIGMRSRFRLAKGPIKGPLEMELTELEPEHRVVFNVRHPVLDWTAISTLRPAGAGTELTYAGEIRLLGWRRLLEPVVAREVRRGEAEEALRLKALLEGATDRRARTAATI